MTTATRKRATKKVGIPRKDPKDWRGCYQGSAAAIKTGGGDTVFLYTPNGVAITEAWNRNKTADPTVAKKSGKGSRWARCWTTTAEGEDAKDGPMALDADGYAFWLLYPTDGPAAESGKALAVYTDYTTVELPEEVWSKLHDPENIERLHNVRLAKVKCGKATLLAYTNFNPKNVGSGVTPSRLRIKGDTDFYANWLRYGHTGEWGFYGQCVLDGEPVRVYLPSGRNRATHAYALRKGDGAIVRIEKGQQVLRDWALASKDKSRTFDGSKLVED